MGAIGHAKTMITFTHFKSSPYDEHDALRHNEVFLLPFKQATRSCRLVASSVTGRLEILHSSEILEIESKSLVQLQSEEGTGWDAGHSDMTFLGVRCCGKT